MWNPQIAGRLRPTKEFEKEIGMELFIAFLVAGGAFYVFTRQRKAKTEDQPREDIPLRQVRSPKSDRAISSPLSDTPISAKQTERSRPTKATATPVKAPAPQETKKSDHRPVLTEENVLDQTFRFIALDVETANADNSSICQLGLALVTPEGHVHTLSFLIDPEMRFEPFNTDLHGISARTVKGYPTFDQVFQALRAFLERHPLVQHSGFDKRAVEAACARYDLPKPKLLWHDSVAIARKAWPELRGNGGHGLANLKTHLGLEFQHHDAAEDAKAAAMVVLRAERETEQSFETLASGKSGSSPRSTKPAMPKSIALAGNQNGPLYGHVVCFTGQLSMNRTEAATVAAGAGMTVKTGVSKKVTLLVVGDQDMTLLNGHEKSTKHRRAEELIADGHPMRVIGESEFLQMVGS